MNSLTVLLLAVVVILWTAALLPALRRGTRNRQTQFLQTIDVDSMGLPEHEYTYSLHRTLFRGYQIQLVSYPGMMQSMQSRAIQYRAGCPVLRQHAKTPDQAAVLMEAFAKNNQRRLAEDGIRINE